MVGKNCLRNSNSVIVVTGKTINEATGTAVGCKLTEPADTSRLLRDAFCVVAVATDLKRSTNLS